jgi:hypothetical protein
VSQYQRGVGGTQGVVHGGHKHGKSIKGLSFSRSLATRRRGTHRHEGRSYKRMEGRRSGARGCAQRIAAAQAGSDVRLCPTQAGRRRAHTCFRAALQHLALEACRGRDRGDGRGVADADRLRGRRRGGITAGPRRAGIHDRGLLAGQGLGLRGVDLGLLLAGVDLRLLLARINRLARVNLRLLLAGVNGLAGVDRALRTKGGAGRHELAGQHAVGARLWHGLRCDIWLRARCVCAAGGEGGQHGLSHGGLRERSAGGRNRGEHGGRGRGHDNGVGHRYRLDAER